MLIGGKTAFENPLLVGSGHTADSRGAVARRGVPRRLTLVADAAAMNRPPGADPFDVRDAVDWLEPVVGFAPDHLRREIGVGRARALCGDRAAGWSINSFAAVGAP